MSFVSRVLLFFFYFSVDASTFFVSSVLDCSCPFPSDGPWANGVAVRDAVYSASATLDGTTGQLDMIPGTGDTDGAEADGRAINTVTFCAVNLKPHGTLGGRFEVLSTLGGGEMGNTDTESFQVCRKACT